MLLRLHKYALKVMYCPGKEMYIADMLSQAYIHDQIPLPSGYYQIFLMYQEKDCSKKLRTLNQSSMLE